jgi:hypothetical protein
LFSLLFSSGGAVVGDRSSDVWVALGRGLGLPVGSTAVRDPIPRLTFHLKTPDGARWSG